MTWAFENKGHRISELFVSEGINIFLIFVQKNVSENRHFSLKTLLEKYVFSYYSTFKLKEITSCNHVSLSFKVKK